MHHRLAAGLVAPLVLSACGATSGGAVRPPLLSMDALPEAERREAIGADPERAGATGPEVRNREEVTRALTRRLAPLDQAALDAGRVYRFNPAMVGDSAVPVWTTIPVTFRTVR
jgi:hypothetical protein